MAHLDGETLDKKIAAGPVPLDDALDIAVQIARGLEAAHRKSIYHRDIKPANVMILNQGSERLIKIMDFGLAQLAERLKLTDLDTTLGTMAYMSPEQTEGAGTDQRTDLWALGCVMYEMISGQLPFRGDYNQAVQYSILHEAAEPLTGLRTGVPMELEWIVDKCLAKNRDERYPEASSLILDVSTLRKKLEAGRSTVARTDRPPLPSEMGTRAAPAQRGSSPAPSSPPQAAQWGRSPDLPGNPPSPPAQVPATAGPLETTAGQAHPLAKYHVIEDLDAGGDSVIYRAEDTQLKRSVTINVVPESAARSAEKQQRLHKTGFYATAGSVGGGGGRNRRHVVCRAEPGRACAPASFRLYAAGRFRGGPSLRETHRHLPEWETHRGRAPRHAAVDPRSRSTAAASGRRRHGSVFALLVTRQRLDRIS